MPTDGPRRDPSQREEPVFEPLLGNQAAHVLLNDRRELNGGLVARSIFWMASLLLLHTYFFYPVILLLLERVRRQAESLRSNPSTWNPLAAEKELPRVTLVVAAYNEAGCIGEKLRNSLLIDYPADRFQILIGSDGSTDGTDDIIKGSVGQRIRLWRGERAGKASVLNSCIPLAIGEIVVLSDANTMIDPKALKILVRHFENPDIGAVCGRLKLFNRSRKDYEESLYWKYESWIKLYEGKRGAVMGANGGLYAIRRRLFTALPASTIIDDFVIATRIMEQGFKVTYDSEALAYEETTEDYQKEFKRRVRIAAGNFQSLSLVPQLLLPSAGFPAFAFWSHKLLRWCAPWLMAAVLLSNLFLLGDPLYRLIFIGQGMFYALALGGKANVFKGQLRRVASMAYYFVTMNFALAVGLWKFLRGQQGAAWDRTARAHST
jgi:cellulose synthase/poly-beta-1,6-N-acetylglucosamine synthase-like glycosyltransferase